MNSNCNIISVCIVSNFLLHFQSEHSLFNIDIVTLGVNSRGCKCQQCSHPLIRGMEYSLSTNTASRYSQHPVWREIDWELFFFCETKSVFFTKYGQVSLKVVKAVKI